MTLAACTVSLWWNEGLISNCGVDSKDRFTPNFTTSLTLLTQNLSITLFSHTPFFPLKCLCSSPLSSLVFLWKQLSISWVAVFKGERAGGKRPSRMPEAQWQLGGRSLRERDQRVRVSARHRHAVILWAPAPAAFTHTETQTRADRRTL